MSIYKVHIHKETGDRKTLGGGMLSKTVPTLLLLIECHG